MNDRVFSALIRLRSRYPTKELHKKQLHAHLYGASLRRLHRMAVEEGSTK